MNFQKRSLRLIQYFFAPSRAYTPKGILRFNHRGQTRDWRGYAPECFGVESPLKEEATINLRRSVVLKKQNQKQNKNIQIK
jgi:hypothetical protein